MSLAPPAPDATGPPAGGRPDPRRLLDGLAGDRRLVTALELPAAEGRTASPERPLDPRVLAALGVSSLWSHQAAAIDAIRAHRSVAVATGTASGKSLCYQAPIVEAALRGDPPATALAVFPTKALAQDQLRALHALDVPGLVPAAYDGDCTPEERTWVRANASVVLTNPEMLHQGILPRHDRWATFLHRLEHVVVDELHVLRGVFGSHVAHLLRRLRRLCAHYGSDPTFVFTSATIGEPARLAGDLCGLPVLEITDDGAPRGPRTLAVWDPGAEDVAPVAAGDDADGLDPDGLEADHGADDGPPPPAGPRRGSTHRDVAMLTALAVEADLRAIAFCRSRRGTEVVAADVARHLPRRLAEAVRPYRAGYLVEERREIEQQLFSGELRGVVATSALELGIDVGGLDVCVLDGFPGTIASLWQRVGRAGRDEAPSLAVLVAGDDQLDQWFVAHPEELVRRPPEPAVVNPTNPHVLLPQLACAAYELPLTAEDEHLWPGLLDDGVRRLVLADRLRIRPRHRLRRRGPVAVWAGKAPPARQVGLRRGGDAGEVRIATEDGTLIGTVDGGRAPRQVHPGAVYLHRGRPFQVRSLDLDEGEALVEPCDPGTYTQPRSTTEVEVLGQDDHAPLGRTERWLGDVRITTQVVGYRRRHARTGALLESVPLDLPPQELTTRGVWFTVDPALLHAAGIAPDAVPGALHAVEHAAIGILPLFTICDRWDVGGVSTALQADTGLPTIVIHDAVPGGAGIAELAFAAADELLVATLEVVAGCPCEAGCPSCVQSPKCGNGNEPLDKAAARALLEVLLAAPG